MKNLSICLFVLGLSVIGCESKPAAPVKPNTPAVTPPAAHVAAPEKKDGEAAPEKKDGEVAPEKKDGEADAPEKKDGDAAPEKKDGDAAPEKKE